MKTQAKKGGEFGANGEWYKGGSFINTVPENPKGIAKAKKKSGKKQIFPYQWAVPPTEEHQPIYQYVGTGLSMVSYDYDQKTGIVELNETWKGRMYEHRMWINGQKMTIEEIDWYWERMNILAEKYNKGERWFFHSDFDKPHE